VIWKPSVGQQVRLHYRPSLARIMPFHGQTGTVQAESRGPGPRNVLVRLESDLVVVPRGNLCAVN
jgi:ribosomal protein L21E